MCRRCSYSTYMHRLDSTKEPSARVRKNRWPKNDVEKSSLIYPSSIIYPWAENETCWIVLLQTISTKEPSVRIRKEIQPGNLLTLLVQCSRTQSVRRIQMHVPARRCLRCKNWQKLGEGTASSPLNGIEDIFFMFCDDTSRGALTSTMRGKCFKGSEFPHRSIRLLLEERKGDIDFNPLDGPALFVVFSSRSAIFAWQMLESSE